MSILETVKQGLESKGYNNIYIGSPDKTKERYIVLYNVGGDDYIDRDKSIKPTEFQIVITGNNSIELNQYVDNLEQDMKTIDGLIAIEILEGRNSLGTLREGLEIRQIYSLNFRSI